MASENRKSTLSIIIPVYNEEQHIGEIIDRVSALPLEKEIVVVDDCSIDRTYEVISRYQYIKVLRHDKNLGKGAAIRTGLKAITGNYIIIQDADLEYPPETIPNLYLKTESNDIIYGSRIKGKSNFLLMSYLANRVLSLLTSILYKQYISDMETCYKLVKTDIIKKLKLTSQRFEIEPEITAKLIRMGHKIVEVPIKYCGRRKGKKIGPVDGLIAIISLIRWRFVK